MTLSSETFSPLFEWARKARWSWRMPFLILLSLVGHAFAFYLFQVVNPAAERVSPQSMPVTVLHPSNPVAAQLLLELEDRMIALWPEESTELSEYSLSDRPIPFIPSFQDHRIGLQQAQAPDWNQNNKTLLGGEAVTLPAVEIQATESRPEPTPEPVQVAVRVSAPLDQREIEYDAMEVVTSLNRPSGRIRAYAGVSGDGGVRHLILESETGGELNANEVERLRQSLHFEKQANQSLQWAWIEIHW